MIVSGFVLAFSISRHADSNKIYIFAKCLAAKQSGKKINEHGDKMERQIGCI